MQNNKSTELAVSVEVLEKMAELRGMDAKTLAKITTENAYRAFQIKNTPKARASRPLSTHF